MCPTPIGNLGDVTLRVLDTLREADAIACEDTRRTRVLLDRYEIAGTLVSYHEHNERERARELVGRIQRGAIVALVSDAGMPLVSDPGYALVQACVTAGVPVEVLPGPSSVLVAVVASGLPAERWLFVGFLPRRRAELELVLLDAPDTLVAFESLAVTTAMPIVARELGGLELYGWVFSSFFLGDLVGIVILGGLIETDKNKTASGVPLLMDIPVLGYLFRNSHNDESRTELIVLIRPTVLPTPEIAALAATAEKNKMPGVRGTEKEIRDEETRRLKQADSAEKGSSSQPVAKP